MFLLLSALSTSLDGFVIGVNFHLNQLKITISKFLLFFFINFILLLFVLSFSSFLPNFLFSNYTKVVLFSILGISCLFQKDDPLIQKKISKKEEILTIISHSIDSVIVSITFLNIYNIFFISFIYAFLGATLILVGYLFSKLLKWKNYNKFISAGLFFLLAVLAFF